ncbi:MAG: septation protein IspZ [Rhodobacteraceae bacterium]|nr:septation protein IspZ [Paracoccaceae bacterium]
MAEERKFPSWVKPVLELAPVIAFFVAYTRVKDDTYTVLGNEYEGFIIVTAAFIPLSLVCTGILWALTGKLSRMQMLTVLLVVVFGGLSVWLNDDRFFKMKPTIIYLVFGGILGVGLLQGKSYLRTVMEQVIPLGDEGWMILTRRFCLLCLALAAANEVVWRFMSTDAWVNFKTFGLTAAMFVFFILQSKLFTEYGIKEKI